VDSTGATYSIDLDTHQGRLDQSGYPLTNREIVQTTLAAAAERGDNFVCVDGTTATAAAIGGTANDDALEGRWLRFQNVDAAGAAIEPCLDGDATPCTAQTFAYLITDTVVDDATDCAGAGEDRIQFLRIEGLVQDFASGTTVWIDYGHIQGDPMNVIAPVELGRSDADEGTTQVTLDGTSTLRAAHLTSLRGLFLRNDGGSVGAATATLDTSDVWVMDFSRGITSSFGNMVDFNGLPQAQLTRWYFSGGSALSNATCFSAGGGNHCDQMHGIGFAGASPDNMDLIVEDGAWMAPQDDYIAQPGTNTTGIVVRRIHAMNGSDGMDSSNFVDDANDDVVVEDVLCNDCASTAVISGSGTVDGFTWLGASGLGPASVQNEMKDFFVSDFTVTTSIIGLIPLNRCVFRNGTGGTILTGEENAIVKNCLFDDLDFPAGGTRQLMNWAGTFDGTGLWENTIFIDVRNSLCGNCRFFRYNSFTNDPAVTFRNLSIVYRPSFYSTVGSTPTMTEGFSTASGGLDWSGVTYSGMLFSGFRNNVGAFNLSGVSDFDEVTWENGMCFFDNDSDAVAAAAALLPSPARTNCINCSTVRGRAPGYVSPDEGRFDLWKGSVGDQVICGTNRAGIVRPTWGMLKAGVLDGVFMHTAVARGSGGLGSQPRAY
jgi:hypothetical protein